MRNTLLAIILLIPTYIYASFSEDFNSELSAEWQGDRSLFKVEDGQLKLDASTDSAGVAILSLPSTISEEAEWRIKGKMNFKPSSSNLCKIYLMADAPEISSIKSGYFITIGGSKKVISLTKITNGKSKVIGASEENRVDFNSVNFDIKVTRNENAFTVYSKINDDADFLEEFSVEDNNDYFFSNFLLSCIYTKTRAKSFSFDYVIIEGESPIKPPFSLASSSKTDTSIVLKFNYPINEKNVVAERYDKGELKTKISGNSIEIIHGFIGENDDFNISYKVCDYSGECIEGEEHLRGVSIPKLGDILINEIMYDPQTGGSEYIELYNTSDKSFSLKQIMLAKPSTSATKRYTFYNCADEDEVFGAKEYALLSKDADNVCIFDNCGEGLKVSLAKFPQLANDGGTILLFNKDTVLIDSVYYDKTMHTLLSASKTKGVSLERSCKTGGFLSAAHPTPAKTNSICDEDEGFDEHISVSNNVITFDRDRIRVKYSLPFENAFVLAVVYSMDGREVKRLKSEEKVGSIGEIEWDGTDFNGRFLPPSSYIVYIHFYTTERKFGIKKRFVCTVGEK